MAIPAIRRRGDSYHYSKTHCMHKTSFLFQGKGERVSDLAAAASAGMEIHE